MPFQWVCQFHMPSTAKRSTETTDTRNRNSRKTSSRKRTRQHTTRSRILAYRHSMVAPFGRKTIDGIIFNLFVITANGTPGYIIPRKNRHPLPNDTNTSSRKVLLSDPAVWTRNLALRLRYHRPCDRGYAGKWMNH